MHSRSNQGSDGPSTNARANCPTTNPYPDARSDGPSLPIYRSQGRQMQQDRREVLPKT